MINTVLFDLDGTLAPFDQQDFIHAYFPLLCAAAPEFDPKALVKAVWAGTEAMMQNDGTTSNYDRFWQAFEAHFGREVRRYEPVFDAFYGGEFDKVKAVLRRPSPARAIVDGLKAKGYTVVLATNPYFPLVALKTRLSWLGLTPEDFALVTHYQNCRACKPNPLYFEDVLHTLGKQPADCLMVGNNAVEDMAAADVGISVYLVTDFLENPQGEEIARFPHGTLDDLAAFCESLPPVE
ncbi:MAG: HAD family hydrolase [Clostridia bacterium]|nr:HAD family hydrolase [Clostridia bacterium]